MILAELLNVFKKGTVFGGCLCCLLVSTEDAWGYQGTPAMSLDTRRSPIQLGLGLTGGFRSSYLYRGLKVGESVLEGQLAGSFSLSNDWALSGEANLYQSTVGTHSSHMNVGGELMYYLTQESTLGLGVAGNWFNNTELKSGGEYALHWRWTPTPDWEFHVMGCYDCGQDGYYSEGAVTWQPLISESIAWQSTLLLSGGIDCDNTDGLRHVMARTGPLIRLGASLRLQPYIAYSVALNHELENHVVLGCWLTWCF